MNMRKVAPVWSSVVLAAVPAALAAAPATAKPKAISAASAFALPPTRQCIADHRLMLRIRPIAHVRWAAATVKVDGRTVRELRRRQIAKPIRLTGLPNGRIRLSVTARASDRRGVTAKRTYRSCVATPPTPTPTPAPAPKPSPTPTPAPKPSPTPAPTPTPTATPTPTPVAGPPAPGSYSGSSGGYALTFFVSNDGSHVQDVTAPMVLGCAPSHTALQDRLVISDVPIAADGSFSATTTQTGVWSGSSAMFTYTFSGQFNGTSAAGTLRETIAFDDGVAYTCTTNSQSFTASRESQGTQTAAAPPAGSYTGASGGYALTLFASGDSTHLQDVTVPTVLGCAPSHTALQDRFVISDVPIAADGSFHATATQTGVWANSVATFTYVLSGHVHSINAAGVERLAGTLRETVGFGAGPAYSCTTDDLYWSATRDPQGSQAVAPPPAGAYTGSSGGYALTYSVSNDGAHLQYVSVPTVLGCVPAHAALSDHLTIADVAIGADGSFASTSTQSGTVSGATATFTYSLRGHVHGVSSTGATRMAGTLREDVAFNNGTAYSCTTNDLYWSASH